MPPRDYVDLVRKEISGRRHWPFPKTIDTIYFGGGTPSLIEAELIVSILDELDNAGFSISPSAEITIEINPATLDAKKIALYKSAGINRFSVGAQTFNDSLLKLCGRKHTAQDTRDTLHLLKEQGFNFSFDLLFALPSQSLAQVEQDVREALAFDPPHLSAYCLTVPEGHPMASGRAPDGEQVKMFKVIEDHLADHGLYKYEISNFARCGFESRHNMIYWTDQPYWGLGLSSHSYLPDFGNGLRFWNPKTFDAYTQQVARQLELTDLPETQRETLARHEALTDYCHIHLRTHSGISVNALRHKFSAAVSLHVQDELRTLQNQGLVEESGPSWRLTKEGQILSNRVFSQLTFLAGDLPVS